MSKITHFETMSSKINSKSCKAARALADISQGELSKRVGVSRKTISDFERDSRNTQPRIIRDIEEYFKKIGFEFEDCEDHTSIKLNKNSSKPPILTP